MAERGSGKIVMIGSVQSRLARPGIAPYSATKGGVVMLTRGLCADLGPKGIQANALCPGYIDTELTQALVDDPEFSEWVAGAHAGRSLGPRGGSRGRAGLPRIRRVGLRQRAGPLRRRRHDRGRLTATPGGGERRRG